MNQILEWLGFKPTIQDLTLRSRPAITHVDRPMVDYA